MFLGVFQTGPHPGRSFGQVFVDEAVDWRQAGMSVDVASECGRHRLSPDDVHVWAPHGFGANAAYVCKSAGLTPEEGAMAYERGEHPAFAAARKNQERYVTLDASARWIAPYPPRDADPDALLSWDDDEDRTERRVVARPLN